MGLLDGIVDGHSSVGFRYVCEGEMVLMISTISANVRQPMAAPKHFSLALLFTLALCCGANGQTTLYVDDDNCPLPGSGSTFDPYCAIQDAIVASADGDTVEVAPGTYFEAIDFIGKAITLRSRDGATTTIIDATNVPIAGETVSVVRCVNGETAETVLDGFMITGGTGDSTSFGYPVGGGMFNLGGNPTVINCTFINNTASVGGGMYHNGISPTLTNCSFIGNTANDGGGMYNNGRGPSLTNCTFTGNTATDNGAGVFNDTGGLTIFTNCTFSGNTASGGKGGAIYNNRNSPPLLVNCILWGDSPDEIFNTGTRRMPTVSFSNVAGSGGSAAWNPSLGTDAGSNIDADPLFVNAFGFDGVAGTADDDLRLMPNSPAIHAGNDLAVTDITSTDLAAC